MPSKTETAIAPTTESSVPVLSPARQSLKEAIESLHRVEVLEMKAADVERAAEDAVQKAHADVAQFNGVDQDLVACRVAALKGETPAKSLEEVKDAQRRQGLAKEELHIATQAHQVAQESLRALRESVQRERREIESRNVGVLSERASEVVAALEKANEEVDRLRALLRGVMPAYGLPLEIMQAQQRENVIRNFVTCAGLPMGHLADWLEVQKRVGDALSRRNEASEAGPALDNSRAYWRHFSEAVLADPTADAAPLPSSQDLRG